MTRTRIYIAGHGGMVGSAIFRQLEAAGGCTIITRSRAELNLTCQAEVNAFFQAEKIDQVYIAAAKVVIAPVRGKTSIELIYKVEESLLCKKPH